MRSVTKAEAQRDLGAVLNAATAEPVRIREAGREFILVPAAEFAEAQELLRMERVKQLLQVMHDASQEAKANGLTEESLPELLKDE